LLHKIRMDLLAVLARTGLPRSHGPLIETERCYNGLERTAGAKQGQHQPHRLGSNSRSPIDRIPLAVRFSLSKLKGNIERAVSGRRPSIL
jgi:hypothetical protein